MFDALNIWDKNSDRTSLPVAADSFKQTTCSDKDFDQDLDFLFNYIIFIHKLCGCKKRAVHHLS